MLPQLCFALVAGDYTMIRYSKSHDLDSREEASPVNIVVRPSRVLAFLLIVTAVLLLAHIASQIFLFNLGWGYRNFWSIKLFDFGRETNIPTLYSTVLLLLSSVLCGLLYRSAKRRGVPGRWHWGVLSALLFFVGVDETAMIHEAMIEPLRAGTDASGIFYFAWVIPYGILLIVIVLAFLRFVLSLQGRVRTLIFVAAGLYILGVLLFEMFGGSYADIHSTRTIPYAILVSFEETLEMVGLNIFVFALLSSLSLTDKDINVSIVGAD
jgi:hypothetical protein